MLDCAAKKPGAVDWRAVAHTAPFRVLRVAQTMLVGAGFPDCAEEGFRAVLSDTTVEMNYRWGALVGLQSLLAAQNRLRELRFTLDSAIAAGVEYAKRLFLLDVLAGVDVRESAAAVETEYERPGRRPSLPPSVIWFLGTWRAQRGNIAKAESLAAVLHREAVRTGDPDAMRYAAALAARLALQRGDTSAVTRLRTLLAVGTRDGLVWELGEPLASERVFLAEFLLARGRTEEALAIAATIDPSTATAFLPFLPASLALRLEAARRLGLTDLRRHVEQQLSNLGRADLLATQQSPQGRSP